MQKLAGLAMWLALTGTARAASDTTPGEVTALPVVVHVASELVAGEPRPVVDRAFLERAVTRASEILAVAGVELTLAAVEALPPGRYLDINHRWARNALPRAVGPAPEGAVEVFVVRSLADLGGGRFLGGVHWRYRGRGEGPVGRHYVIMGARNAGLETLAHELGHYFGLPHTVDRRNIMTTGRGRRAAQLRPWQLRLVKRRLALFLRLGKLVPQRVGSGAVSQPYQPHDEPQP